MKSPLVSVAVVDKVAHLAKLTITTKQQEKFAGQLSGVIDYVSKIQALDTDDVEETSQVTGLTNILRKDVVDENRMFSQKQALSNAKKIYKGYFVVPAIFEE